MNFIDWDESFSVGIDLIDNQHKKLFETINNYHSEHSDTEESLSRLLAYIDFHFTTEEDFFHKFDYEDTIEHTAQHLRYKDEINALYSKYHYRNDDEKIRAELEEFIRNWITHHIKISDKQYTQCFKEHGL
jgi:hemerythrin-like metal-binding protein